MTTIAVRIASAAKFQQGKTYSTRDVAAFINLRDVVRYLIIALKPSLRVFGLSMGSQITDISVSLLDNAEELSGMLPSMTSLRFWKEGSI